MYYNKKWYDMLLLVLALKGCKHFKASKSININPKDHPNGSPNPLPSLLPFTQNELKPNGLTFKGKKSRGYTITKKERGIRS
jgi:hypothetical protein